RNTSRCGRPEQRGFGAQKSSSREDCAKRSRDDYGAYRWRTGNFKKEPAGSRGVVQNRAGEISGSSTCAVRNGTGGLVGPRRAARQRGLREVNNRGASSDGRPDG